VRLYAPRAWLGESGWVERVLLTVGADGCWCSIDSGVAAPPADAVVLPGPALPGLVDAHSHAFQRAFAGLAERLEPGHADDDFWAWRERMYAVALRVDVDTLRAVAAHLYVELLAGGYTEVCEFHYLQHRPDGTPYPDDPLALAWALADAAGDAGIGLTILPVAYERGGFDGSALGAAQRRFALDADSAWQASRRIADAGRRLLSAGVGIHSLRAAAPDSIARLASLAKDSDIALHVHAAEQTREVDECVAATGLRPIEWLAAQPALLDPRWHLVHATHATPQEIDAVAAKGAGIVLCPSTEGNLGDGLCDLPRWLAAQDEAVSIAIGTDSHIGRDALEELRWLEYGQRLAHRRRVVSATAPVSLRADDAPRPTHASAAARLLNRVVAGGGAAAGRRGHWGLAVGARADLLVVDTRGSALVGIPDERLLDALVFSSPKPRWREVWVAGERVIDGGRHRDADAIAVRFDAAMQSLWSS